jgi:DNA-binding PadR family transcriptional regulator
MSVRHAILGLLSQRPLHGYMLRASFENLVGGEEIWDVKPAQIYTTLSRLEEAGLVRREGVDKDAGPEKRIYAITDAGREHLARWFATGIEGRQRDELYVKLMLSLDVPGTDAYAVIHAQRGRLFQELHDLTERRGRLDPRSALSTIFLLDKTLMHVEADLRWLDMIEARLDEMRKQQSPPPASRPRGRPRKGGGADDR